MRELLELILKNITTHPDEVIIEMANEEGREIYNITVNPEDMGRVIGKNGKVIRAIRSLAHVIAIRQGKRFRINVTEIGGQPSVPGAAPVQQGGDDATSDSDDTQDDSEIDLISGAIDISDEPETVESTKVAQDSTEIEEPVEPESTDEIEEKK